MSWSVFHVFQAWLPTFYSSLLAYLAEETQYLGRVLPAMAAQLLGTLVLQLLTKVRVCPCHWCHKRQRSGASPTHIVVQQYSMSVLPHTLQFVLEKNPVRWDLEMGGGLCQVPLLGQHARHLSHGRQTQLPASPGDFVNTPSLLPHHLRAPHAPHPSGNLSRAPTTDRSPEHPTPRHSSRPLNTYMYTQVIGLDHDLTINPVLQLATTRPTDP